MHENVEGTRNRVLPWLVACVAVVAVGIAYVVAVMQVSGEGRVLRNTTVLGVPIGGLSEQQARERLALRLTERAEEPIPVVIDDTSHDIVPAEAGLRMDVASTVAALTGITWRPDDVLPRIVTTVAAAPRITVDEARLRNEVDELAVDVEVAAVEPSIAYEGVTPVVRKGTSGASLDRDALVERLPEHYLTDADPLTVTLTQVAPTLADDVADAFAAGTARTAVAAPVTVIAVGDPGGETLTPVEASAVLEPEEIAAALQFTVQDGELRPTFDAEVLSAGLGDELAALERPGRDATFRIEGDRPVVVPSSTGLGVRPDELVAAMTPVLSAEGPRTVRVALGVIEPDLTTQEAEGLGVVELVSTFTQNYPYARYREINIGRAAELVNGTLVLPGGVYSHNATLGERTPANGYTKGFIIGPGGVFREELGGGVSASATATWTAAFYAGMEPVQVRAHSIWIPRYRPGLEATVSWGNLDMSFRNPGPHAVFITATTTRTSMTVSFWGTRQFDEIRAESGPREGVRSFSTVRSREPSCLEQDGMAGFRITVTRVFVKDGTEVRREPFTTQYRPSPTVVCTASATSSPSPTRTPTRTPTSRPPSPTPTMSSTG